MQFFVHVTLTCLFSSANAAENDDLSLLQTRATTVYPSECLSSIHFYPAYPECPDGCLCTNINIGQPAAIGGRPIEPVWLKPVYSACGPNSISKLSVRYGGTHAWPEGGADISDGYPLEQNPGLEPTFIDWERVGTESVRVMATEITVMVGIQNCGTGMIINLNEGGGRQNSQPVYVCISKFIYSTPPPTPSPTLSPTPSPTPEPTTPPTTTTTTTTTTISLDGLEGDELETEVKDENEEIFECKTWCYSKKHKDKSWEGKKCHWYACTSCPECTAA
jgi:hypothetical protein